MQQLLAKKEAHLEGQQAHLAAWAAELQHREAQLAAQQARLEGRAVHFAALPGSVGSSPLMQPIPSDSPVLLGRGGTAVHASAPASSAAASSPLVRRALAEAAGAVTPTINGGAAVAVGGSGAGTPTTPALPGEWQEEFEEGVHLTYTSDTIEGGATKLKRIRFSRTLFTAESAKQVKGAGVAWRVQVGCEDVVRLERFLGNEEFAGLEKLPEELGQQTLGSLAGAAGLRARWPATAWQVSLPSIVSSSTTCLTSSTALCETAVV